MQRALAYALKKDAASARSSFERALALDPDSTEAVAGLVSLDSAAKDFAGQKPESRSK